MVRSYSLELDHPYDTDFCVCVPHFDIETGDL